MANEIKLSNATSMINHQKMHTKSSAPEDKSAATATTSGDRVSVTDAASRLQSIEKELSALPDVNHEKVAGIKKAIADGSFSMDPARIAEKLINFENGRKI